MDGEEPSVKNRAAFAGSQFRLAPTTTPHMGDIQMKGMQRSASITFTTLISTAAFLSVLITAAHSQTAPKSDPATSSGGSGAGQTKTEVGAGKETKTGWVEDLTDVDFPKMKAAGKLHGEEFTLDRAELQQGTLTLRQGREFFADREWKIFLFANDISRLEGHFLNIETEDTEPVTNMPHVYMSWKPNAKDLPKTKTWTGSYVIKLKFGHVVDGKLPGQIYLCVPDMKRSFIAGSFEAVVK